MKKSKLLSDSWCSFALKNILVAAILVLVAIICVTLWLRRYTQHGIEVSIPAVIGMHVTDAQALVDSAGLQLVVIDSTYSQKVPLGTIVEQTPPANAQAKLGRALYVIVNAQSLRQIPLPDLRDISYRQAEATLHTIGFNVKDYLYEPSEFKDIVLDVRVGNESVEPGQRLNEGTAVVLVIGRGKGTQKVRVPNLIGKSLIEARSLLLGSYLTLGRYTYDEPPTEETESLYVVYKQEPIAGTDILEGSLVHIQLSTDIEKAISTQHETRDEEEFF